MARSSLIPVVGLLRAALDSDAERTDEVQDLATVYRAHAPTVLKWAIRLGGPGLDPEDVLQEVFITVERHLDSFRGDAKITTWLYKITANEVRRQRKRQRTRGGFAQTTAHDEIPSDDPGPAEELERKQRTKQLYRLLDRLPEKYRTVLILHELEQMSGPEIATLLNISPSAVWVRLHRARARLDKLLNKEIER